MLDPEFAAFLKQKKAREAPRGDINWTLRKSIWMDKINGLFQDVESWLDPYKNTEDGEKLLDYVVEEIEIHEERLGTYTVPSMKIQLGSEEVKLEPMGLVIIGGLGRIDMIGPLGRVMMVLSDTDQASRFQICISTAFLGDVSPPHPDHPKPSIEKQMQDSSWYFERLENRNGTYFGRPQDHKPMLRVTEATFIEMLQYMVR
ncbi:MAG: hypothetical protein HQL65_13230 [Magnetococcales bacterium]|nr:hypothetical protein [Magnetococcales bacterium]